MKPWVVMLESIFMLILWIINALMDAFCSVVVVFTHNRVEFGMVAVLGVLHFVLNCMVVKFQWRNINKCGLLFLLLTQTAAFYMILRRAWRSFFPCCTKDDRTKRRKAMIAKYSLNVETWQASEKYAEPESNIHRGSCIPNDALPSNDTLPDSNSNSTTIPISSNGEKEDMLEKIFSLDAETTNAVQEQVPLGITKFKGSTHDVEFNFNAPPEIDVGEPDVFTFVRKTLQLLILDHRKLSFHIILNSSNKILHMTKSDKHILNLPPRKVNVDPPYLCNDIHYAVNITRGNFVETFAVTKRTEKECNSFIDTDISKFLWFIVWPSGLIKLFAILEMLHISYGYPYIILLAPITSIFTWLITNRRISDSWKNTLVSMLLKITLTVPRTLLVICIGLTGIIYAVVCYITVKVCGFLVLVAQITYMKKFRNVELYTDPVEIYTFDSFYHPLVQFCESIIYVLWAIWWHTFVPVSPWGSLVVIPLHLPLIVILITLIFQTCGMVWLWFGRTYLQILWKDAKGVLYFIQSLEYIRT